MKNSRLKRPAAGIAFKNVSTAPKMYLHSGKYLRILTCAKYTMYKKASTHVHMVTTFNCIGMDNEPTLAQQIDMSKLNISSQYYRMPHLTSST